MCLQADESREHEYNLNVKRSELSRAERQNISVESRGAQYELPAAFTASDGAPWFEFNYGLSKTKAIGELDQGADGIESYFAVWIHVAEVADFHEPGGKHVLEKTSDELDGIKGHDAPAVAVGLSVLEGNAMALDVDNAAVGDGHFEDVGSQILDAGVALPYSLAVDVPLHLPNLWRDEIKEAGFLHLIAEFSLEDSGKGFDRQIEVDS